MAVFRGEGNGRVKGGKRRLACPACRMRPPQSFGACRTGASRGTVAAMRGLNSIRRAIRGWRDVAGMLALVAILAQAALAGAATPRAALDPYVAALGVLCAGDHDGVGTPTPADHDGHGGECCLAACLGGFPAGPALAAASAPALVAPRLVVVDRLIADARQAQPILSRSGFDARGPPLV